MRIRLVEVELLKLKLDAENPRLHSAYLTHELPADPSQPQLGKVLERLPEFQSLVDSIARNNGCFQPPLVTFDYRVLEGNRRTAALRRLRTENPRSGQFKIVTIQQLVNRVTQTQEKAIRAKFHLEGVLAWDHLSQLTEYLALAEREGADFVASMLGRYRNQIEPLLVAGRCVRKFSESYPQLHSQELLWVLVGLCGVVQIEPAVAFSRTTRFIFTDEDEKRPAHQPYTSEQMMKWVAEERFTKAYADEERRYVIRAGQAPKLFRRVHQSGQESLAYFLEAEGSLAKAIAFMESGYGTLHRQQKQVLNLTQKYLDLLNQLRVIRKEETPDLHRQAYACYHQLGQLLGIKRREKANVH